MLVVFAPSDVAAQVDDHLFAKLFSKFVSVFHNLEPMEGIEPPVYLTWQFTKLLLSPLSHIG